MRALRRAYQLLPCVLHTRMSVSLALTESGSCSSETGVCSVENLGTFTATLLGPAMGVAVHGRQDLLASISDSEFAEINRLFLEHQVVCIRNQTVTPLEQIRFTERWGAVEPHPYGSRKESHPDGIPENIMVVRNTQKKGDANTVRNDVWHSDLSCMEEPVAISVLHAVETTTGWGDTMFASGYKGYESLSPALRTIADGLKGVHNTKFFERPDKPEKFTKSQPDTVHPVVRTHPKTGKKSLFVSENFMERFEGMTADESEPLKDMLIKAITKPEHVYRHRWHSGDVVIWDNRCVLHYGVFDYDYRLKREMRRTTAAGDRPF